MITDGPPGVLPLGGRHLRAGRHDLPPQRGLPSRHIRIIGCHDSPFFLVRAHVVYPTPA